MKADNTSISLPSAMFDDDLNMTDIRVAVWIAKQPGSNRWVTVDQGELANIIGKSRPTINAALQKLVTRGWMQERRQSGFRAQIRYRIKLDTDDEVLARMAVSRADNEKTQDVSETDNDVSEADNDVSEADNDVSEADNDVSEADNDVSEADNDVSEADNGANPPLRPPLSPTPPNPPLYPPQTQTTLLSFVDAREAQERCFEAAGPGLADPSKTEGLLMSGHWFRRWQEAGISFEEDILPVIAAKTALERRGGQIASWAYFDRPIRQHHAERTAPTEDMCNDERTQHKPAGQRPKARAYQPSRPSRAAPGRGYQPSRETVAQRLRREAGLVDEPAWPDVDTDCLELSVRHGN